MILLWVFLIVAGLGLATYASGKAVDNAAALAFGLSIPPFFVGITLLAFGTDLPEIANSIISSAAGHGDLNVGDSLGSTVTQITLVLGILPFAGGAIVVGRTRALWPALATIVPLLAAAVLLGDGYFDRWNGAVLIGLWLAGSIAVFRHRPPAAEPSLVVPDRSRSWHLVATLLALALVAAGATAAVFGMIETAEILGVPEFVLAFFAASIGTSLPELVVAVTAARRKERDLAVGDIFGSSMFDATLSIGAGPVLFPVAVDAGLSVRSALFAAVAVAIVLLVMTRFTRHSRATGLILILVYLAFYPLLLL